MVTLSSASASDAECNSPGGSRPTICYFGSYRRYAASLPEPPAGSSEVLAAYYRRCARELHVAQQIAEKPGPESREMQQIFVSF